MNKQQLANKIWESANKMRSKIEANEYKDYILGFIFYKFLSDKEEEFLKANGTSDAEMKEISGEDEEEVEYIQNNIGYFIAYNDLFSTWLSKGRDFDVSNVRDALSAFSRYINPTHKKVFDKIFNTLETGLSKLGDTSGSQTKAINGLLQLIRDIPMDGKQDYDVLGFIYEYLISMFAANAGKKAGEFYTPHEVSLLMSEIIANYLQDRDEIKIYDPTSGSGSLLINIGRSVSKHILDKDRIKYFAQEIKENTYNLTRMNLVMRGIIPDNIVTRNGDTLEDDWPYFDENDPTNTYEPLYVDAVVSNPPYSQNWDPVNKEIDARFKDFGVAPKSKADYAFLLHDLFHLKPDGIMTIVLPHGVLFRGGEEGQIRKNLIEKNNIDAIIGLPPNIFFGTGIPTIIMILKKKRITDDVLIIDASKNFAKVGKNNQLRASDIKKIVDVVCGRESVAKFAKVVTRDEIRANDYNLNIPRYVDSSEKPETWDIYASMYGGIPKSEVAELQDYWNALIGLEGSLFADNGTPYVSLSGENVKDAVIKHAGVTKFKDTYARAFADFGHYLKKQLIEHIASVNINQEEAIISEEIFGRLQHIPLIDKYTAYQALDDEWAKIAVDLEIIQTEGMLATKKVDPNMVIKKKNGKDTEVQEGWVGHIFPFTLVQDNLLQDKTAQLKNLEERLSEIAAEREDIIDNLTEEEKDSAIINDDGAFISKEVTKAAKEYIKQQENYSEEDFEYKIIKVSKLQEEEKAVKTDVKKQAAALEALTKETIEGLSDAQVALLLELKWISHLIEVINKLPDNIINELVSKIQILADKYAITFGRVENDIKKTEGELLAMLDNLEGNEFDMKGLSEFKSLLKGE